MKRRADPRPVPPPLATPACRALIAPLVLGMGLLLLCLCLSSTEYLKAEPIFQAEQAAGEEGGETEAKPPPQDAGRQILVPIIPLESRGRQVDEVNSIKIDSARQRVAANILIRSGYLADFSIATDDRTGLPDMRAMLNGSVSGCAWMGDSEEGEANLSNIAVAVVAIEKFNRNAVQRRLEWWYSRLVLKLSGHLPDFSVGPAQIRPSTVRRAAAHPKAVEKLRQLAGLGDAELLDHLMDECSALGIAAALLQQGNVELKSPEAAIRAYGGQRRETQAVIDYVPVVFSINAMIRN